MALFSAIGQNSFCGSPTFVDSFQWFEAQREKHKGSKVEYPKYVLTHWPYLLASTMGFGCCEVLNYCLKYGLFLLLFMVFLWEYILNWIKV